MKQFMMLVVLIGSFWVGQVWADMDRVSFPQWQKQTRATFCPSSATIR